MKAEEFSVWLFGGGRLSADQRREGLGALASLDGGRDSPEPKALSEAAANGAAGKASKRRRPDALGRIGDERVESRGVRIARGGRSSPGAAPTGFRGSAARVAGAP